MPAAAASWTCSRGLRAGPGGTRCRLPRRRHPAMEDRVAESAPACGPDGCEVPGTPAAGPTVLPRPAPQRPALRVDVVSDAICPWCWVGKRNLDAALDTLAREDGERFEVHWRPFQLN